MGSWYRSAARIVGAALLGAGLAACAVPQDGRQVVIPTPTPTDLCAVYSNLLAGAQMRLMFDPDNQDLKGRIDGYGALVELYCVPEAPEPVA